MRLLALFLALLLAACGPETHIAKPSDEYLTCSDEPNVPPDPVTDADNAAYLQALRDAGQDCRSKVDYLRDWFRRLP